MLKRIKKKFVEWLLKDIDAIKVGKGTCILTSDFLELASLTSDPSLAAGRLWFRSDLRRLRYSDGARAYSIQRSDFLEFEPLTSDPTLSAGRVWYRGDLGQLIYTDGTRKFGVTPHKVLRSGRYYGAFDAATAFTTRTISANYLYAYPMFVPEETTFDRIAINVTTAATGSARVGVYTDAGAYPGNLVDGSDVAALDTGTTGVKENTISVTLAPGIHWLAIVASAAPTLRAVSVASCDSEILGLDSTLGTAPGVGYYVSYTFGPLPTTFPSGASVDTGAPFLVALRKA
ncbi:MAG: hypothetical protein QXM54_02860 [Desulfurococcaceae archaeon]